MLFTKQLPLRYTIKYGRVEIETEPWEKAVRELHKMVHQHLLQPVTVTAKQAFFTSNSTEGIYL